MPLSRYWNNKRCKLVLSSWKRIRGEIYKSMCPFEVKEDEVDDNNEVKEKEEKEKEVYSPFHTLLNINV